MEKCYHEEYGECTLRGTSCYGKTCTEREKCRSYITETDFFLGTMNGTLKEVTPQEDTATHRQRMESLLRPEKSKKQRKHEEKLAAEKEKEKTGDVGGFSLADDPAFKAFLEKNKKK